MRFSTRNDYPLEVKTCQDESGENYMAVWNHNDEFHVFSEVQGKEAAKDCGAPREEHSQFGWKQIWDRSQRIWNVDCLLRITTIDQLEEIFEKHEHKCPALEQLPDEVQHCGYVRANCEESEGCPRRDDSSVKTDSRG